MHTKKMQDITRTRWQELRHGLKLAVMGLRSKSKDCLYDRKQLLGSDTKSLKNVWSDANTSYLVRLRGSLSDLSHSFREKFMAHRYQLTTDKDQLQDVDRTIAADQKQLVIDIRGLRLGALKIVKQYDPATPLARFGYAGKMRFSTLRSRLGILETRISEADPVKQLKRGYTITTRANGQRLADGKFEKGELLTTKTQAYILTSKLTEAVDEGNKI